MSATTAAGGRRRMGPREGDWPWAMSAHAPVELLAASSFGPVKLFGPSSFLDPQALWPHKLWVGHVLLRRSLPVSADRARRSHHPWAGTGARSCKSRKGRRQARSTIRDRGPCPNGASRGRTNSQTLASCDRRHTRCALRWWSWFLSQRRARKNCNPGRREGGGRGCKFSFRGRRACNLNALGSCSAGATPPRQAPRALQGGR